MRGGDTPRKKELPWRQGGDRCMRCHTFRNSAASGIDKGSILRSLLPLTESELEGSLHRASYAPSARSRDAIANAVDIYQLCHRSRQGSGPFSCSSSACQTWVTCVSMYSMVHPPLNLIRFLLWIWCGYDTVLVVDVGDVVRQLETSNVQYSTVLKKLRVVPRLR